MHQARTARSYRDLRVWQRAIDLIVDVYRVSGRLSKAEPYGLTSQIRRAAVSIAANIAEGNGRSHLGEYLHHLSFARASLTELETHLIIAARLGYLSALDARPVLAQVGQVGAMLSALITALQKRQHAPSQSPVPNAKSP